MDWKALWASMFYSPALWTSSSVIECRKHTLNVNIPISSRFGITWQGILQHGRMSFDDLGAHTALSCQVSIVPLLLVPLFERWLMFTLFHLPIL